MTTTFHTFRDLPGDVRGFWERAGRGQDPAGYFTGSPEWVELMDGEGAASIAVVRGVGGRIAAVLPMLPRPWELVARVLGLNLFRRRLNTLKIGGGDLIEDGIEPAALAAGFCEILARHPDVDAIWFEHVGAEARLLKLGTAARTSGAVFLVSLFHALPHVRLTLPETREQAMALRSAKSVSRLRSKEKALAREVNQPLRVVEIRAPDDWVPYEERIERLVNQSWQAQLFGQQFRLDSVRGTALRGWLRGFLLLAGEEALAFTMYYQGMGTMVSAILAYDRRYAKFSPGAILFLHTLERLYAADRPEYLDFGEGDADYKRQWANHTMEVGAVLLVRRRMGLAGQLALYRAARGADRLGRRVLQVMGVERLLARRAKRGAGGEGNETAD